VQSDFSSRYIYILKPLGLSDYEIRVYITLIETGPTNYRVLVKDSNVPTGKIYQVLSALESKGFIEAVEGKPRLFRAVEPRKAFRRRFRQIEDDYLDLERKIGEAMQSLQFEYDQKYEKTQGIVTKVIFGLNSFERIIKESLFRAEVEVLVSSSDLIFRLHLEESIKDLRLKGVNINALCPSFPAIDNGSSSGLSDELMGLGVNARVSSELIPTKYLIVDNRGVSLFLDGYEDETCVQIQSAALSQMLRGSFMLTWGKGRPLTQNHKKPIL